MSPLTISLCPQETVYIPATVPTETKYCLILANKIYNQQYLYLPKASVRRWGNEQIKY